MDTLPWPQSCSDSKSVYIETITNANAKFECELRLHWQRTCLVVSLLVEDLDRFRHEESTLYGLIDPSTELVHLNHVTLLLRYPVQQRLKHVYTERVVQT